MSHFVVLVVTDERPSKEKLAEVMQPWHEYECTGVEDQYVVPVDKTDEVLEQFNEPKTVVVLSDGSVHNRYDDKFYTGPAEPGIMSSGRKTFQLPEGAEEREMPAEEARKHGVGYMTPAQAAEDYFGIEEAGEDGRFYRLTNPNAKWDWHQVGGRYTGRLMAGYDPETDPENQEVCWLCAGTGKRNDDVGKAQRALNPSYTCNGCDGKGESTKWPTSWRKVDFDCVRKGDVRWDTLRSESEKDVGATWDKARSIIGMDATWKTWKEVREMYNDKFDLAREFYNNQEANVKLRDSNDRDLFFVDLDSFLLSREDYVRKIARTHWQPFALVMDGKWCQKGEMGWWGIVTDESEDWGDQFDKLIDGLPDSKWLTVVDCHI